MLAAIALNAFLAAFGGTWSCAPERGHAPPARWTIAAAPGGPWTRVTWRGRSAGGTGYVGYLTEPRLWTYEDFRDDGSFVTVTSPGPAAGAWTWMGTATSADGVTHLTVEWRRDGTTIRRAVGRSIGASFRASARDVCRRATP